MDKSSAWKWNSSQSMNTFRSEKILPWTPANLHIAPQKCPRTQRFYGFIMLRGSALITKNSPSWLMQMWCEQNLLQELSRCWLQTWPKLRIDRLRSCEDESTCGSCCLGLGSCWGWCSCLGLGSCWGWCSCLVKCLSVLPVFNLWIFSEGGPSVRCTSLTRRKEHVPRCPTRSSSLSQASVGFLKFKTSKIKSGWILKNMSV